MGEVIIKWFYFYYFRFCRLFERAMLKNQNQKIHCAHAQIFSLRNNSIRNAAKNDFKKSRIFWLGQNMKNDVNSQEMLCNKISENPRTSFLQLLARGMNKIKKRIYFRTLRHSSFLLPPDMEFFTKKRCILGHPIVHTFFAPSSKVKLLRYFSSNIRRWNSLLVRVFNSILLVPNILVVVDFVIRWYTVK